MKTQPFIVGDKDLSGTRIEGILSGPRISYRTLELKESYQVLEKKQLNFFMKLFWTFGFSQVRLDFELGLFSIWIILKLD